MPATKAQPKEMLPIIDTPIIQYIVQEAIDSGIEEILIITGKNKKSIEDHFDRSFELEYELEARGKSELLGVVKGISNMIDNTPIGKGGEIQLTDALVNLSNFKNVLAYDFVGKRHDAGDKLGYLKATVEFALEKEDLKDKLTILHNDMIGEVESRFPSLRMALNNLDEYDKMLSVSENTSKLNMKNLSEIYNIDKSKFVVLENIQDGNDIVLKSNLPLENEEDNELFNDDSFVFITIGRLSPEKNQQLLVNAFYNLLKNNPTKKIKLLMLGQGPLEVHIKNLIKKLNLEKHVKLLGIRDNPYNYLKKSDCFVFPSKYEGQGIVILESYILNKPVIATKIPTSIELLEKYGGLLVDGNVEDMSKGLDDVLNGKIKLECSFDVGEYNENVINKFYSYL